MKLGDVTVEIKARSLLRAKGPNDIFSLKYEGSVEGK
jgi:hypothetical protein